MVAGDSTFQNFETASMQAMKRAVNSASHWATSALSPAHSIDESTSRDLR